MHCQRAGAAQTGCCGKRNAVAIERDGTGSWCVAAVPADVKQAAIGTADCGECATARAGQIDGPAGRENRRRAAVAPHTAVNPRCTAASSAADRDRTARSTDLVGGARGVEIDTHRVVGAVVIDAANAGQADGPRT